MRDDLLKRLDAVNREYVMLELRSTLMLSYAIDTDFLTAGARITIEREEDGTVRYEVEWDEGIHPGYIGVGNYACGARLDAYVQWREEAAKNGGGD